MFKSCILIAACFLMAGCIESVSYRHHPRRRPEHRPVHRPQRPPMPRRAPVVIVKRVPNQDRYHRPNPKPDPHCRPAPKPYRHGNRRYVSSVVYR